MEKEVWKPVPSLSDRYMVSSLGRVMRLEYEEKDSLGRNRHYKEEVLNAVKSGVGYYQVRVNHHRVFVHRLVANAFYGTPIKKGSLDTEIHHKNHDKSDNSINNLEVVTRKENIDESVRYYSSKTTKKLRGKKITYRVIPKINTICSTCNRCKKLLKSKKSRYCLSCRAELDRVVKRPEADELFYLLMKYPFTFVGNLFGVSDKSIAKWCMRMEIPSKSSYYRKVHYKKMNNTYL